MFCCHAARQETQEKRPRVDDTIIDHGGAQHATGAPGSLIAASGLVLAASGCTWVAPESGPWAEPLERVCGRKVGSLNAKHVVASEPGPHPYKVGLGHARRSTRPVDGAALSGFDLVMPGKAIAHRPLLRKATTSVQRTLCLRA